MHDESGALLVRPLTRLPLRDFSGKVTGTFVPLANGSQVRALVGNLDLTNARWTQHFLTLSLETGGAWFHLARYHDSDFSDRGPQALAAFLRLDLNDVFPISYDIRSLVRDPLGVGAGTIVADPPERLSRSELIALAIP